MALNIGTIQPSKNTASLIADALRSAILQGKLQSGQSLKQDEIAAEFKVSKIPVREALVQLQAEGLVNLIPSRGATVSTLTLAEVEEIYIMRRALEPIALRRAVPLLTPANFIHIESILDQIDHEEDMTKWVELNGEFHALLYAPSKMPLLIQNCRTMHNNVARYLVHYLDKDYLAESQQQHRNIVASARSGNADAACALLENHLGDPVQVFAEILHK